VNENIVTLTWVMTGETVDSSPAEGINNLSSHVFNQGVTTIQYTVTDAEGLSATCSFTVTVLDNVDPVAMCRDIDIDLDLNSGIVTISPEDIDNGSYDNCAIDTMYISKDTFNCLDLGDNTVTLTVVDFTGNSAFCTALVSVDYSVDPDPGVSPDSAVICSGTSTDFTLSNTIPVTSWTWTVSAPSAITGASDDQTGEFISIRQVLTNSDSRAHQAIYEMTPTVYELCVLDPVTAKVWVNPSPEIVVTPEDTSICNEGTAEIFVSNANTSILGDWSYNMTVEAGEGMEGYASDLTGSTLTKLTETLTNLDSTAQDVAYRFTPQIVLERTGLTCEGPEQVATVDIRPSLYYSYEADVSDYNGYNISCYERADGSIDLSVREGAGPLYFQWSDPNGNSSSSDHLSDLGPGMYTLTVTDDISCTYTEEFQLIEPDQLEMTLSPSISIDGDHNINCAGDSTGTIDIEPYGYVDSLSYYWRDGSTEGDRAYLPAGDYTVIIVDKNNCTARSSVTLTEPDPMILFFSVTDPYCPESPDGEISVEAIGGIRGYDYIYDWSNGATTSTITELTAGLYEVTVTDQNLCSVIDTVDLIAVNNHCLTIPNAISPNGDMINDVWNLGFIDPFPEMEVIIMNAWGQTIWESEPGYPDPWGGTSNGKLVPIDSYFYIIYLHDDVTEPITGHVTVIY
jgi:gliding motility-associated-like protein